MRLWILAVLFALSSCASAQELFMTGVQQEQERHYEQAADYYTRALEKDPGMAKAYNNRALALLKQGRVEQALLDVERALEIQPEYAAALSNRGLILESLGKPAEAFESYKKASALSPAFAEPHYNAGQLSLKRGDAAGAVTYLEKAHAISPQDREISLLLGRSYLTAGAAGKAIQVFAEVNKQDAKDREALLGLFQAHRLAGNLDNAIALMGQYMAAAPDCYSCLGVLGSMYAEKKDYDRAIEVFERIAKTRPTDAGSRFQLGFLYHLKGRSDESARSLKEYLALRGAVKDDQREKAERLLTSLEKK